MKSIINHIKRFILLKPEIINANFKYQLGQTVYFLNNNTVTKGKVTQCRINLMEHNNTIGFRYGIAYGIEDTKFLPESLIYSTKEELAQSLLKD